VILADGTHQAIAGLLHPARGVIVTTDGPGATAAAAGWAGRVDVAGVLTFPAGPEDAGTVTETVLIRPDGHVAWAAPGPGSLPEALGRWFGAPRAVPGTTGRQPLTSAR
jgi:bifunctional hydroxylase/dehydrase